MMGGRADVVLSDMAANTTGHRKTDQLRIIGLVENAAAFATDVLNPGGTFVAKVFQSGAEGELLAQLKRDFATVKHVKPASSRQDLSERYVLAMGFRGERRPARASCSDNVSAVSCERRRKQSIARQSKKHGLLRFACAPRNDLQKKRPPDWRPLAGLMSRRIRNGTDQAE